MFKILGHGFMDTFVVEDWKV